jgi:replicative DNA helicase
MDTINTTELYDTYLEASFCGSILVDGNLFGDFSNITPNYFHDDRHKRIWEAFQDIKASNGVIDYVTVSDMIRRKGDTDTVTENYLTFLLTQTENTYNAYGYGKSISDYYHRRELLAKANEDAKKALDLSTPLQSSQTTIDRFKLGKASDAFNPRPKVEWVIQNTVKTNSVNVWYGKYGHKKTFVALSAAVCVASGTPWIGQSTKQTPVLIIDEESGRHTLLDRLQAAIKGESQSKDIPIYYLSLSAFNFLKNENDINILKRYIEETESKLVIIDAFADVMSGGDENSVQDNVPVLIQLRKVCEETNSAIILLHHTNKGGEIRGSTSIGAALNSALKIESENGSSNINITTEKMRDSQTFNKKAEIVFVNTESETESTYLESFYITEGEQTPFYEDSNNWENDILDYMKSHNGEIVMKDFLTSVSKEKKASYNKALYALRDKGKIKKSEKSTSRLAIWTVSEAE